MNGPLPTRDDYEDRLIDQGLAEVLGGKRPPDLSDDILAAANCSRWSWRRAPRLAVAAALLIVSGTMAMGYRQLLNASKDKSGLRELSLAHIQGETSPSTFPDYEHTIESKISAATNVARGGSHPSRFAPVVVDENAIADADDAVQLGVQLQIESQRSVNEVKNLPGGMPGLPSTAGVSGMSNGIGMGSGMGMAGDGLGTMPGMGGPPLTNPASDSYDLKQSGVKEARFGKDVRGARPQVQQLYERLDTSHLAVVPRATVSGGAPGVVGSATSPFGNGSGQPGGEQGVVGEADSPYGLGPGQPGDQHSRIVENPFLAVTQNPLSTFSIDVDTASYAKTRRYLLEANMLPPPDAVRIEELVNYFSYDYPAPEGSAPFSAQMEVAACPWQAKHRLLRVGLKGKEIATEDRPASNLVFLLDVSGSMTPEDRLPRVRRAMKMLVEQLGENDRVAIVVYAAASGLALPSTPGYQKEKILTALENLQAGGSTNGAAGIHLAYDTAAANLIKGGTNRVVLCTDGDFNVGVTSTAELERVAEEKAKSGVFLTVLGFGMGNHNDDLLEKLADKGNGNYGYVDSEQEAKKLLVDELGGTLVTIAKDVKIQIEFNPRQVAAYRLVGYENRLLRAEDFNDDTKDAGEIGAGHSVTALYELIPAGEPTKAEPVDELKYQQIAPVDAAASEELLTLKLRYKDPDGQESHEPLVFPLKDSGHAFGQASSDFKFASAVASFGMLLRNSEHKGDTSYDAVQEIATSSLGPDKHGYRAGFLELVRKAKTLSAK